ncbi:MAG: A24 family peptidase [Planctomycetota bacterium]|jgi:Flp pilus assembly protein protease CpaA
MESASIIIANVVAASAVSAAAVVDVREYRVPNILTIPLLLAGFAYYSLAGGLSGLQMSLLGAFCGFISLVLAYGIGILGAGDVKLMAAVGAWLGLGAIIAVVIIAAGAAVVYSFGATLVRGVDWTRRPWKTMGRNLTLWAFRIAVLSKHFMPNERVETVVAKVDDRRYHLVPFAAMVAVGCVCVFVCNLLDYF